MTDDLSRFVPKVHFEQIPIKNLVSNQDYQRSLSTSHIMKAVENFDLNQINPVKVSRRDGINYVFNGQHTIEIVAAVSGSRDTPVWCMIYDDLTYSHEADIFANQQKFVKQLKPFEVFYANVEAGNEDQLMVRDLLKSYGLEAGPRKAPGMVCAISTVEAIYLKYGYHVLDRVLRLIVGAWEGDNNSFSGNIFNAVARMVIVYGNRMKDSIFIEKVGGESIKMISRTAKDRRAGALGYAETMVNLYNHKFKNQAVRLPLERLYTKESIFDILNEGYDADGVEDEDFLGIEQETMDFGDDEDGEDPGITNGDTLQL